MKPKLEMYVINDITEECWCNYCGAPLYVGDTVYTEEDEEVFCSPECHRKMLAE